MIKRMRAPLFKHLCLLALTIGWPLGVIAEPSEGLSSDTIFLNSPGEIIFAAWTEAPEPFAASSDPADNRRGLIRDIGYLLAEALRKEATFKPLPGGRIQVELLTGRVHFNCLTSPKWWRQPKDVHWTVPLFAGGEGPLMRADMADSVVSIEDLAGKKVSIYRKYAYDSPLKKLIEEGRIEIVQVDSLDKALSLLELGRIDAHIEFSSVSFRVLENPAYRGMLKMAPLRTDSFSYSCAVADSLKPHLDIINAAIQKAQQRGEILNLLQRYNFPESHPIPTPPMN